MDTKDNNIRILVADDNAMMRSGLCSLLKSHPGWIVCGEAIDGRDAVQKAVDLRPDVILVDVSMPHLNGFETAKCIHDKVPEAEILIVTEQDSRSLAHFPLQAGVRGYVMKSRLGHDLSAAVEAASKHQPLSATLTQHLMKTSTQ